MRPLAFIALESIAVREKSHLDLISNSGPSQKEARILALYEGQKERTRKTA